MTSWSHHCRSVGAGLALALLTAVTGCKTTESLDGTARPQAIAPAPPAASPILGTGY
jgi:hypothetical protein